MKITEFMFRIAAIVLTIAALTCTILANLEKISAGLTYLRNRIDEKRAACYPFGSCHDDDEFEDWVD